MLSDRDISLAHPEAFDFVFGNLPSYAAGGFTEHLTLCRYCRSIVAEYTEIGRIIQDLPPQVEPPADLEDRTVGAMLAALADDPASSKQPAKAVQASDAEDLTATKVHQLPQRPPPAPGAPATSAQQGSATVTPLSVWRRHQGLTSIWLAAAAVIAVLAVVVIFRPSGGHGTSAQATVLIPLRATAAAKEKGMVRASGRATARQAGQSWTYVLTVRGLKPLSHNWVYECWYVSPKSTRDQPRLVSGGTFVVDSSGSTAVPMTSGVDPRDFPTMVITAQPPGDGAVHRPILLTGKTRRLRLTRSFTQLRSG